MNKDSFLLKEGYNFLCYDADEAINCRVFSGGMSWGNGNCIILKLFELTGGSQFCEGNAEFSWMKFLFQKM